MTVDYLSIPSGVKKAIIKDCANLNVQVILLTRASLHPDDAYLYVVLAKKRSHIV